MMQLQLDECLAVHDGRLRVEGCAASDLAARFGTPLHVVSEDQLRRNARRLHAAFAAAWPHGDVRLLPSIKANLTLALRHVLNEEGTGCDVFGAGELEVALRAGTDPALISLNGPAKDDALLERAVRLGVRVTLDSADELERLGAVAGRLGRRAVARVRLRPPLPGLTAPTDLAASPVPIAEAVLAYKPGIALADLLGVRVPDGVEVRGAHLHFPRHTTDVEARATAVRAFAAQVGELSAAWGGWRPRELDVGGGIPSPRDPTGRALEREVAPPAPLDAYARATGDALAAGLRDAGLDPGGIALEVEPGRALYGDAGVHLTRVLHVKRDGARTFVETDTSEAFLPDGLVEHNAWTVLAADAPEATGPPVDVVGRSCGFDVLAPAAALPAVAPGDVLVVLDTGAYQDATSSTFNALPRPATVLVTGARAEVVKRAETLDEVLARDVVPVRLGGGRRAARLDHAGLTVADLDRSLAFYAGALGLAVLGRGSEEDGAIGAITGAPGARAEWADLDAGDGRVLELLRFEDGPPAPARAQAPGTPHVALAVDDLDAAAARACAAGGEPLTAAPVTVDEPGDWHGVRCLYVRDPDGALVELLQRPPTAASP